MARMLVLCSLPRTNPGNQHQYKRVNGPYRLYMQAGPATSISTSVSTALTGSTCRPGRRLSFPLATSPACCSPGPPMG